MEPNGFRDSSICFSGWARLNSSIAKHASSACKSRGQRNSTRKTRALASCGMRHTSARLGERNAVSTRTKDALEAAKARGQKLGNPNRAAALRGSAPASMLGVQVLQQNADEHAERLRLIIQPMRAVGIVSFRQLAEARNRKACSPHPGRSGTRQGRAIS